MICRINIQQTNYKIIDYRFLDVEHFEQCEQIYKQYIEYKKIESPHPIFIEDFDLRPVFGYYDNGELCAFSITVPLPSKLTVLADQFAWNYKNPKLKLGYKSIRSEIAYYKNLGYEYFILGDDDDKYKKEIQGFELITPESKGLYSTQ